MWTQSEDAHQATHNGNNTTIASQAIKRCDAFDEEGGEIKLIIPLIKEVGKLFFFCSEYKLFDQILSDRINHFTFISML